MGDVKRFGAWWVIWAWCLFFGGVVSGCTSGGGSEAYRSPGLGQLGSACQKTEDCASGLCVRVDDSGGVCTIPCAADAACPKADNWACLSADDPKLRLCACRKLANREVCGDGIDNDCDGKVDDCRICNGIGVENDDPLNCGKCGNVCGAQRACKDGACVCSVSTPTACGAVCTNTETDGKNCGACGVDCGSERACKAGACQCNDITRPDFCPGIGCVALSTNTDLCGACDKRCGAGQECKAGACVCPSSEAPDFCPGVGCVKQTSDAKNCGQCGNECPQGQVCTEGACACPTGTKACGDHCVTTDTDPANCGACGNACGPAQLCAGGACGCQAFGYTLCSGQCADLVNSTSHCGACGKACGAGEVCLNGSCACPSNIHCGETCVPYADNDNCGACGVACTSAQYCAGAQCQCLGSGLSICGAACVALGDDEANCGSCGTSCKPSQVCSNGSCGCPASNQQFCAAQNTCLDVLSDTKNCGACGKQCNPGEACQNGVCGCSATNQAYCASANTCVDTQSNVNHCGACDKQCKPTEVCSYGYCQCPSYDQSYCANANACVSLYTDNANCGACGKQCPAATHCSGACQCDTAGLSLCGDSCKDLQTDPENCNTCGHACGGNLLCTAGQCKCPSPTTGNELRLTTSALNESHPVAVWDGTHVGVVYMTESNTTTPSVRFALLNPDGSRVSDVALSNVVYPSAIFPEWPAIAWSGSEYGVVWQQDYDTYDKHEIFFQRVGSNGQPIGSPVSLNPHTTNTNCFLPGIAWSNSYGGFAVSYGRTIANQATQLVFRRIGTTGLSPENENAFTASLDSRWPNPIAAAPDGTWGLVSQQYFGNVDLSIVNADGSKTLPTQSVGLSSPLSTGGPWLLHDGSTWLTAWIGNVDLSSLTRGVMINRGTAANTPFLPFQTALVPTAALALVNQTLAVGFAAGGKYRMQRFALPTGTGSSMANLHPAIDISTTATIADLYDMQLVATGTHSLLAIWADNRWGSARELYTRTIDLQSCP